MRNLPAGDALLHEAPVDIERRPAFHINQRHVHRPVDRGWCRPHQDRRNVLVPMLKHGDTVAADRESGPGVAVTPRIAMCGENDEILFAIRYAARGLLRARLGDMT